MTDQKTISYLEKVFRLDPQTEAHTIVEERSRFHGLKTAPTIEQFVPKTGPSRDELREQLDTLRQRFWQTKPNAVEHKLDAIDANVYPDLREQKFRLQTVNRLREQFVGLLQADDVDAAFVDRFRKIVVANNTEALKRKDSMLRSMAKSKHARTRQTIKVIRKQFPELYELEQDWLDLMSETDAKVIRKAKKPKKEYDFTTGEDSSWSFGWTAIIFIFFLLRILSKVLNINSD